MSGFTAIREITIAGRTYAPGELIDPTMLKPRTLTAMLEQRQIAHATDAGDKPPAHAIKRSSGKSGSD